MITDNIVCGPYWIQDKLAHDVSQTSLDVGLRRSVFWTILPCVHVFITSVYRRAEECSNLTISVVLEVFNWRHVRERAVQGNTFTFVTCRN